MKFDASRVQPDKVVRCREILDNYTVNQAQVVSAGAATFYVWVSYQKTYTGRPNVT